MNILLEARRVGDLFGPSLSTRLLGLQGAGTDSLADHFVYLCGIDRTRRLKGRRKSIKDMPAVP